MRVGVDHIFKLRNQELVRNSQVTKYSGTYGRVNESGGIRSMVSWTSLLSVLNLLCRHRVIA
jgi:hypothetical protein